MAQPSSIAHGLEDVLPDGGFRVADMTTTVENDDWVLIVDAVILSATIIGGLMILASMAFLEWKGRPSTTRMRLVQSLVLSDLLLGIVGLTGVTLALHPGALEAGQACDGLGVAFVAVIWSEHLWTLALAIATFLILIHPLHPATLTLEKNWWVLWVVVWVTAFAVSVGGFVKYGVVPSGGICYYPSSTASLFGSLMQFIPRAIVFIIITSLYAKLFVFLRRPDKIRSPYSNSPTGSLTVERRSRLASVQFRPVGVVSNWFKKAPPKDFEKENVLERRVSIAPNKPTANEGEVQIVTTDFATRNQNQTQTQQSRHRNSSTDYPGGDIPPWERVELPAFEVDGQRFGGASANLQHSNSSNALWGNWKGLGGTSRESRKRPSTTSSTSPVVQSTRKFGSGSSASEALNFTANRTSPTPVSSPRLEPIPSVHDPLTFDDMTRGMDQSAFAPRGSASSSPTTAPSERYRQFSLTSDAHSPETGLSPAEALRRSSAMTQDSRRSSGAQPTMRGLTPINIQPSPSDSDGERNSSVVDIERAGTGYGERGPKNELYDGEAEREEEDDRRTAEAEADDDWDLMRMLQQSAPPRHAHDRFAPGQGETVELVEESMASYLNRKTALLMLWFPLGYVLLFSVSLIRIIYDFAGHPPVALRAISRWFIFSQGVLDALIYGLVEWHTKRVVRRRVKKGTFSAPQSNGTSSWPKLLRSRGKNSSANATGSQQQMSQMSQRRDPRGSTISGSRQAVTFGRIEERSILRELDLLDEKLEDGVRRGSGVDSVDTKGTAASGISGMTGTSGSADARAGQSSGSETTGDSGRKMGGRG